MKNVIRIPSKLYRELYELGGDKLLAVYCILKGSREGEIKYYSYKSKNNKKVSSYALLRAKTCLSLHSIEKYVPLLIDLGLCYIHKNGDFILLGGEKLKEKYNTKLVPIKVGKNLTDTALNVISVRLYSERRQQNIQIKKKQNQRDLLKQDNPRNLKELKKLRRLKKLNGSNSVEVNDKTVLSNQGFAVLKDGSKNNKHKGAYWKKRLKDKGIISTERNFNKIVRMTFSEYLYFKLSGEKSSNQTYFKGWLVEETVSSFCTKSIL